MLTPEQRTQTLPETTTTASNKATNTSSLSIVSIGMPVPCSDPYCRQQTLTTRPPSGGKASPNGDWACGTLPQQADQRSVF